jgi:hypothetical protein
MIRSIGVETAFLQSEALVTEFVDLYGRESVILKAGISPDEMQLGNLLPYPLMIVLSLSLKPFSAIMATSTIKVSN